MFSGTILKGKEEAFAKSLHELAKEPVFNCMNFESLINDIRTHVAEVSFYFSLWGMVALLREIKFSVWFLFIIKGDQALIVF